MERSLSYDFTQTSPSLPPQRQKRLRGVVATTNDQGGTVQLANRRFAYRTQDLISSQLPEKGESVTFILSQDNERGGYRARKLIPDSAPHFLEGRDSLSDCYRAHADKRAKRQALLEAKQAQSEPEKPQAAEHLHCQDCQKMVVPKRERRAGQWLSSCPYCNTGLDRVHAKNWMRPILLVGLLASFVGWWHMA